MATSATDQTVEFEKMVINYKSLRDMNASHPAEERFKIVNEYIQDFLAIAESALNLSYSGYHISLLGRSIVHKLLCRQLEYYKTKGVIENYEIIFDGRNNPSQSGQVYSNNTSIAVKLFGINSVPKIDRSFMIVYLSDEKRIGMEGLSEIQYNQIKESPKTPDDVLLTLDENLIQVTDDRVRIPIVQTAV